MYINPWAAIQQLIDKVLAGYCPYDIDDVYVTFSNTEPAQRWPGTTWEQMPKHNHAYASFQKSYPANIAERRCGI